VLGTIHVRVSVKDSGPGVSVENSQHLFQMYGQVSAGKTQKGSGTGLGLSISKSIVELRQCCCDEKTTSRAELIENRTARRPLGPTIFSALG
jgi:K+-sensing histidine kinase KdpD